MATTALGRHYPLGTRVNERGHLEIGGCDVVELVEQYGTPAYIFAEQDMRARARSYMEALGARTDNFEVLYASKAFPAAAAYRLFSEEGLSIDVASGGELYMALRGGVDPKRIFMHGNNKTEAELRYAIESGVGQIVLDNFDEIDRLEGLLNRPQQVLVRVTPGIKPSTHSYIQTGQLDSKFGFGLGDGSARRAVDRVLGSEKLELAGVHAHIGSQIFELEPYAKLVEAFAEFIDFDCKLLNIGGGLGIAYTQSDEPPSVDDYVEIQVKAVEAAFDPVPRILMEPGRSLVGNAGVTAYRIGALKEIEGVRTYAAVDGGMSDNLRPMLYGAGYDALIANRADAEPQTIVTIAGMHCESSDIIVKDIELADPQVGDILVTPATGAYGYAMASNYNGVLRSPVIFCKDGDARVVVRRETYEDLGARDA